MPRVDATIDDDLFALLETEAERREVSKAALLRNIIQEYFNALAAPQTAIAGADELKALSAKLDALTRYMCLVRPIDDHIPSEEEKAAGESWKRVKRWENALLKKEKTDDHS